MEEGKIVIHHTNGNHSYYYTEKMRKQKFFFISENYDSGKGIGTKLDFISVGNNSASIYELYDGEHKQSIELYLMVKLVVDHFDDDNFISFVDSISSSSMSSNSQTSEESRNEIYGWLWDKLNDFLEETK